jgi:hypothetical protein
LIARRLSALEDRTGPHRERELDAGIKTMLNVLSSQGDDASMAYGQMLDARFGYGAVRERLDYWIERLEAEEAAEQERTKSGI